MRSPEERALASARIGAARALYSDEAGNPTLRSSFVVYLDELGSSKGAANLDDATLREHMGLRDRLRWFLHDDHEERHQRLLAFSDNIVLGCPLLTESIAGFGLGFLLGSVSAYQLNLANRGRFLRGGIALGPLYMDHDFVTGSGLVDAVELEERVAVNPRIVLARDCVELILDHADEWGWGDDVLVDADGRAFINYLPGIADDEIPGDIERGLDAHRNAIQTALELSLGNEHVREKYVWLSHYHNHVCHQRFDWLAEEYEITDGLTAAERKYPRHFRDFMN